MKEEIFVDSFHNLKFSEIKDLEISKNFLPTPNFYKRLYEEIDKRKASSLIENKFIQSKISTGENLFKIISELFNDFHNLKILSSGAGLGITEKYLAQKGLEVSAQEFSKSSEFWSDEVKYISSLDGLKFESFDLVYEVSTLYNFSDKDLEKYLFKLTNLLKKGGYLIIYEQECRSLLGFFIGSVKSFVLKNINLQKYRFFTLWGYLRKEKQIKKFLPSNILPTKSYYFDLDNNWNMKLIKFSPRVFGRQIFFRKAKSQLHIFKKI